MIHKIPVCLCCDENNLRYVCVTVASVAYTSSVPVDFYLLHTTISLGLQKVIVAWIQRSFPTCTVTFVDVTTSLTPTRTKRIHHFPFSVFGRSFAPELLPGLDRIIYLDADTIVLDDIIKLYQSDMDGYPVAAVHEYWLEDSEWGEKIRNDIAYLQLPPEHRYFSSGVLVMDCRQWRQQRIAESLLLLYDAYREITQYPDQDPLNKLFADNYKELDAVYNATDRAFLDCLRRGKTDELLRLKNGLVVRRFAGNKPWNQVYLYSDLENKGCSDQFNDWWFFASLTPFCQSLENDFLERQMADFRKSESSRSCVIGSQNAMDGSPGPCITTAQGARVCKISYRLLGFLPLFRIECDRRLKRKYRLFNKLTLMTIKRKEMD